MNQNPVENMRLRAELDWLSQAPDLMQPPAEYRCPPGLRAPEIPDQLPSPPIEAGHRLGKHFENIVFQYLKYNPHITDIKRNIQIKEAGKTLGELDFLVCIAQHWVHLEVALKLYLLDGTGTDLAHFVGTRRDDCLAAKWRHMLLHQVLLDTHPAAARQLAALGIRQPIQRALWVKGWLFYPFASAPPPLPDAINPRHQRGWWLRVSRLEQLADQAPVFLLPSKTDWLLPAAMMQGVPLDLAGLRQHLLGTFGAHLVVAIKATPDGVEEVSRGFVVPDSWPEATP